jgi:hypothetical protein
MAYVHRSYFIQYYFNSLTKANTYIVVIHNLNRTLAAFTNEEILSDQPQILSESRRDDSDNLWNTDPLPKVVFKSDRILLFFLCASSESLPEI